MQLAHAVGCAAHRCDCRMAQAAMASVWPGWRRNTRRQEPEGPLESLQRLWKRVINDRPREHPVWRLVRKHVVTGVVSVNVAVYTVWQVAAQTGNVGLRSWMAKHFLTSWQHLRRGRGHTLLTSGVSHKEPLHLFLDMMSLHSFERATVGHSGALKVRSPSEWARVPVLVHASLQVVAALRTMGCSCRGTYEVYGCWGWTQGPGPSAEQAVAAARAHLVCTSWRSTPQAQLVGRWCICTRTKSTTPLVHRQRSTPSSS